MGLSPACTQPAQARLWAVNLKGARKLSERFGIGAVPLPQVTAMAGVSSTPNSSAQAAGLENTHHHAREACSVTEELMGQPLLLTP